MTPLKSFRAERAADERTNNAHVFPWKTKSIRDDFLELFDPARALVNEQTVRRLPFHGRRISLNWIMIFDRRGINDVDLVGGAGERAIDISPFHLQFFAADKC